MGVGGGQVRFKTANEYKAIQSLQSATVTEAWKTTGMGESTIQKALKLKHPGAF